MRYAALAGFDYSPPKYHPFNPLPSLRMSLTQVSESDQHAVISAIFNAGWSEAQDLGDVANLISILKRAGIATEGFEQKIKLVEIKNALISETGNAIARGVFGVPTIIIKEQLFWGNDQYDHMQLLLEGNDPVSPDELDSFTDRPRMIDRKAITNKNGHNS
jgi:2-hydroxychromene-2-carboxylate isomerase